MQIIETKEKRKVRTLSVILSAGGVLFDGGRFVEGACAAPDVVKTVRERYDEGKYEAMRIIPDTSKAVFVPTEYFEPSLAEGYMREHNLWHGEQDTTVLTLNEVEGIIPIALWSREIIEALRTEFADRIVFVSPLENNSRFFDRNTVVVNLCPDNVCITYTRGGKLIYAEVFPCAGEADLLYYLKQLDDVYKIRKKRISLFGSGERRMAKSLDKFYKTEIIVCV